jgi:hypothetical protein
LRQATADLDRWGQQLERSARPGEDTQQRERGRAALDKLRKQLPEVTADLKKRQAEIEQHRAGVTELNREASWRILL